MGSEATLATHLALKQDGLELYGFADSADRDFFELILTVSGVGPKTALSVLRKAPREALEGAIGKRDLAYLTKVVGLGKKSAEKMLVELADKIGPIRTHAKTARSSIRSSRSATPSARRARRFKRYPKVLLVKICGSRRRSPRITLRFCMYELVNRVVRILKRLCLNQ